MFINVVSLIAHKPEFEDTDVIVLLKVWEKGFNVMSYSDNEVLAPPSYTHNLLLVFAISYDELVESNKYVNTVVLGLYE